MLSVRQGNGGCFVRDYTAQDRSTILSLWSRVFREAFSYLDDPPALADFERHFDEVMVKTHRIWVAVVGEHMVGFLSASGGEVRNLFVDAAHQRQGIGTTLLQTALRQQPGIRTLSTLASNAAARRFYEKNGFALWRTEPHTFRGQQASIYRLRTAS